MASSLVYSTPQAVRHGSFTTGLSEQQGKKARRAALERRNTVAEQSGSTSSPAAVCLQTVSPLERFRVAKEQVSTLFDNIQGLLQESGENLLALASEDEVLSSSDDLRELRLELETERSRMRNIAEKVRSNQMKVAFFGRTSNGKSSTINALLHDRVLPSGIGHTTNCFCCVEGTSEEKGFLQLPGSDQRKSIEVSCDCVTNRFSLTAVNPLTVSVLCTCRGACLPYELQPYSGSGFVEQYKNKVKEMTV